MKTALLALVLASVASAAQAAELRARVDKTEATLEDQIVLTVSVVGVREGANIRLPALPDFDVQAAGTSQRVEILDNRMNVEQDHTYVLTPRRAGTFTIGPAQAKVGGMTLISQPITLRIGAAGHAPATGEPVVVKAEVSAPTAYVGQQLQYTIQVLRKVQISSARLEQGNFDGFTARDDGKQNEFERLIGGERYLVTEIRKTLVASRPGKLTLPAPALQCSIGTGGPMEDPIFGGMGRGRRVVVRGQAIDVTVKPLPKPVPPGFSGLIGKVVLEAQLSKQDLTVGDSATLTIAVRAESAPDQIPAPHVALPAALKSYEDKPLDQAGVAAGTSQRTFKLAVVPTVPGEFVIPAPTMEYLDSASGTYQQAVADARTSLVLRVTPGAGGAAPQQATLGEKRDVKVEGEDLLPIHARLDALEPGGVTRPLAFGAAILAGAPALALVGLWIGRRRRERDPEELRLERRSRALARLRKDLKGSAQGCDSVAAAFRAYLGDKLDLQGRALAPREAAERLRERGVDPEVATRVSRLLERCEAAQYGAVQPPDDEVAQLVAQAVELGGRIERAL